MSVDVLNELREYGEWLNERIDEPIRPHDDVPFVSSASAGAVRSRWLLLTAALVVVGGIFGTGVLVVLHDRGPSSAQRSQPTASAPTGTDMDRVEVPSVVGLQLEDAISQLQAVGLVIGIVTEQPYSARALQIVASMSPAPGTFATKGDEVTLIVEAGPPDPILYGPTDSAVPVWPTVRATESPALVTSYGLQLCSGGDWTKHAAVVSDDDVSHQYEGTLCPMIELSTARNGVATCSSMTTPTTGLLYARCSWTTDRTVTSGAEDRTATDTELQANIGLPTALRDPSHAPFSDITSLQKREPTLGVRLSAEPANEKLCFEADIPGGIATGCFDRGELHTGLVYGAFADSSGAMTVIGFTPDDVKTIEVAGHQTTPNGNVWRYDTTISEHIEITATGSNGIKSNSTQVSPPPT